MVASSSLMKRGVQRHHAVAGRRMPAQQVAAPCRPGIAGLAVPRTSTVMTAAASSGASSGVAVKEAVVAPSLVKFDKLGSTEELSHDEPEHVEEVARGTSGSVVLEERTPNKATVLRSIVFVTSEVAPWSKTGGLADVVGSLPYALAARGHRVMVVAPRYSNYKEATDTGVRVTMLDAEVGYFHYRNKGVDFVFVDHPAYPRPGGLYSDQHGPYGDNQFRFTLLSLAACEAPFHLKLEHTAGQPPSIYGEDVVFIANDWHAALVPVYIAAKYRPHGVYKNARSILAIHNLLHQGVFPPSTYAGLGLPGHWYGALEWQYPPHQRQGSYAEEGRSVNHLKAGIAVCDRLVTVSAGYSEEIKTWLGGWGMDGLLTSRSYVLNGIINGIDTDEWNPATDPHLAANYDETNYLEGKRKNKLAMQKELGLPQNENIPLIAFIGRLDPQKGADILLQAAPRILNQTDAQLVCLGSGTQDLENGLRWLESAFPSRARGWVGFNVPFSHRLTAAADILVMPSRFEPCGLNQLYAMRYGTVPVAHKTGGLRDTVIDFNPWKQSGTGWTYTDCSPQGLVDSMSTALMTYKQHRKDFEGLQLRGMQRDASWDLAAQQYEQIVTWAVQDPPYVK